MQKGPFLTKSRPESNCKSSVKFDKATPRLQRKQYQSVFWIVALSNTDKEGSIELRSLTAADAKPTATAPDRKASTVLLQNIRRQSYDKMYLWNPQKPYRCKTEEKWNLASIQVDVILILEIGLRSECARRKRINAGLSEPHSIVPNSF